MQPTIEAVAERATGEQVSRIRSLLAAVVIGGSAAVLTYRFLRRGPGDSDEPDGSGDSAGSGSGGADAQSESDESA